MAPSRNAAVPGAARGLPSARTLREEIFEKDRCGAGIEVARAAELRLARRVALVIEAHGEAELLRGRRETPHALGLVAFLAGQGQRQPDHERVDRFFTRDPFELREILDDASSDKSPERSREAVRVIANGEADAAIADVKRSEEHTSELQSQSNLVCRLLLEKKKKNDWT